MRTMTVPARKRGRPESPRSAAIRENMEEQSIRMFEVERLHQLGVQAVEQLTLCNRQLERGELKHATDHSVHTGRT